MTAAAPLSPRFARLVRESWLLLVVAAFLYLSLILATYTRSDPGWSFTGSGAPLGNRGGTVGAWLADLLLYLFGLSAWWWVVGGVVVVLAGYRRVVHPEHVSEQPVLLALIGFALTLAVERGAGIHPPVAARPHAAAVAGRRARRRAGPGAGAGAGLQRRHAAAAGAVRGGHVVAVRHFLAAGDGAHRRGHRGAGRMDPAQARGSAGSAHRPARPRSSASTSSSICARPRSSASRCWSCRRWSACPSRTAW